MFRCLLCKAESQLQIYESLLFSISNKQKNISIDKTEEEDDETVYESTSKGFWKMSQKEFLLMSQFKYFILFIYSFFFVTSFFFFRTISIWTGQNYKQ